MEGFELFNNTAVSRVVNKITITKNYMINFPSAFYTLNNLQEAKTALLYFNKTSQQVAIEFKKDTDERGFKIISPNGGIHGGYIMAKNFFVLNNLLGKIKTGRYNYEKKEAQNGVDKTNIFLIQLEYNKIITAQLGTS